MNAYPKLRAQESIARLPLLACVAFTCLILSNLNPAPAAPANEVTPTPKSKEYSMPGQKLLEKLKAEVRQGNEESARSIVAELSKVKPPPTPYELSQAADFLIDRKRWELAKTYLTQFPQSKPGWGYVLVKHWAEESGKDKAKIEFIDTWLKHNLPADRDYWTALRVELAEATDSQQKLLLELEADCRRNPDDLDGLRTYLTVSSRLAPGKSVAWLTEAVHPKLAYDNYRLADWLHSQHPAEALKYLEHCRSMPFSSADQKAIVDFVKHNWAMSADGPHNWQSEFSQWVRSMLVECYQKTGASEKAQALLLELSREQGGKTPHYALSGIAGQIQSTTPLHPLEDQIIKAEPANENSVDYWKGRASYYEGRKDFAKQSEALERALKLAQLGANSDSNRIMIRSLTVRDYAQFLRKRTGDAQALSFLWKEFTENNYLEYRTGILRDISDSFETDNTHYLETTDERLWTFLSQRKQWDLFDQRLLWRMARNASPQERPAFWQRAEKLALAEGSREEMLGWVMNRCAEPRRSLPLLQAACRHLQQEKQEEAYFTLLESYLDLSDWRNAEKIWPEASKRLTEHELPDWMGRIAVAAARLGDKHDALRLWQNKDKIDFAAIQHLDELKKYGMKAELLDYYTRMQKARPASTVPAEALQKLNG